MKKAAVILLFGIFVLGCKKEKKEEVKLDSFPVTVEAVSPKTLEDVLVIVGSLKAKDEAVLYSRVPGKLLDNLMKEGDPVKKGQAVALVERDEVGVKYKSAPVPSTLNGVIGRIYLDRGTNVTPTTPVALVIDNSGLLVQGNVPENYSGKIKLGQEVKVQVESYPDEICRGFITKVSPVVDPQTRTSMIEAKLNNKTEHLKSGMFAELSIIVQKKNNVLAVPLGAVGELNGENFIFAAEGDKAVKRIVKLGLKTKTDVEIVDGLTEGAEIVTFGLYGLQDGSSIEKIKTE